MKKMVCDICGGEAFRKEGDSFVCQSCGVGYSLEDAKKLLKEVGGEEPKVQAPDEPKKENLSPEINANLKEKLLLWAKIFASFERFQEFFSFKDYDDPDFYKNPFNHIERKYSESQKKLFIDHCVIFPSAVFQRYLSLKNLIGTIDIIEKDPVSYPPQNFKKQMEGLKQKINETDYDLFQDLSFEFWIRKIKELMDERFVFEEFRKLTVPVGACFKYRVGSELLITEGNFYPDNPFLMSGEKPSKTKAVCRMGFENHDGLNYIFNSGMSVYAQHIGHFYQAYAQSLITKQPLATVKETLFGRKVVDFKVDLNATGKMIYDIGNEAAEQWDAYLHTILDPYMEESKKIVASLLEEVKELEKEMMLPYQYRSLGTVLAMIRILDSGKATTWKELAIEADTAVFRETVVGQLNEVNKNLEQINRTIYEGFKVVLSVLNSIARVLVSIDSGLASLDEKTESIRKNTRKLAYKWGKEY